LHDALLRSRLLDVSWESDNLQAPVDHRSLAGFDFDTRLVGGLLLSIELSFFLSFDGLYSFDEAMTLARSQADADDRVHWINLVISYPSILVMDWPLRSPYFYGFTGLNIAN